MKAFVDKNTCIGCGICPDVCPEVFEMDADGKAVASDSEVPDDILDNAKDAEDQCPVDAISVR
ncbi:ferredoxin [Abyssisolibacter fermentans]|uniref:ferredoxin n=1 Tax=Abyssisolibacter fermentans TaxID=1766203 RepID=UPI0008327CBB|nr:ferredoxin [Abyssisolibacter fermentans]